MSETRALYRPGRERRPPGDAMPIGTSPEAIEQRTQLQEHVAALIWTERPLPTAERDAVQLIGREIEAEIDETMRVMTLNERVMFEIEMGKRFRTLHSYDYDPVRY